MCNHCGLKKPCKCDRGGENMMERYYTEKRQKAEEQERYIRELEAENKRLREAAEDFIHKVDTGQARSVDSYNKFKKALGGGSDGHCEPYFCGFCGVEIFNGEKECQRCKRGVKRWL